MKINEMICPNCGHKFYTEFAYGTCDSCQCCFYAGQSVHPDEVKPIPQGVIKLFDERFSR